jgi:type I restriction enzyme S subunit
MAGERSEGMDAATAALFPNSMEESELGLIPKGWEVRSLDEISEYLNGLAMQKFPVTDEDKQLPVIKIAQLRAGNTQGADVASGLLDSRFIIKDGDILFSWSGTLEVETWAGGPGALNQHLFKVSGKNVPDWYSYLSTKSFLSFFREIASGKATTMGHIQRGHLSESKLAIPNLELLNRATEIIEPLIFLKIKTSIESRNLAEIRDSLLPRLISGELQIPEEMLAS